MSVDAFVHQPDQRHSDFATGQFPAYLLPDGTWRFGANAKKAADAAWADHRAGAQSRPGSSHEFWPNRLLVLSASIGARATKAMKYIRRLLVPITRAAKAFQQRRSSINEVARLDSGERAHIAHDLGVSPDELRRLSTCDGHAADLLIRRMHSIGLEPATVPSAAMRDLQRCCSLCTNKVLCVYELEDQPRDPAWPSYCPNGQTLAALGEVAASSNRTSTRTV